MNKHNLVYLPFSTAKSLIQEADILLFRNTKFNIASFFIKQVGEGVHSHVALASWYNNSLLECVEFSEKTGGRIVNLETYNNQDIREIDVYRPVSRFDNCVFNEQTLKIISNTITLDNKAVTKIMRKMTSLPYGWRRIWWIAKHKMIGFRLFFKPINIMDDTLKDVVYPVCSTAVAYAFSKNGCDLVKNRADEWTEPAHIASSGRLSYLFTLKKNNS